MIMSGPVSVGNPESSPFYNKSPKSITQLQISLFPIMDHKSFGGAIMIRVGYRDVFLPSCLDLNVGIFDRAKISGQTAVRHRRIVARFAFSLYFDPPPFQVNARHTLR